MPGSDSANPGACDPDAAEISSSAFPSGVQCALHRDWEALDSLEEEWDELVATTAGGIHDTYAWKKAWWEVFGAGRELLVVLVRRDAKLIAIAPLFRETQWIGGLPVRLLRPVGCDFIGTIARLAINPGCEDTAASALAAFARTRPAGDWDLIQLGPLAGSAFDAQRFLTALEKDLPRTEVRRFPHANPQVFFDLPQTYEQYLAGLSGRTRYEIRRRQAVLTSKGELTPVIIRTGDDFDRAFESLVDQHRKQWRRRGKLGYFGDRPRIHKFHREFNRLACPRNRAFILNLLLDDAVIASDYAFHFGDTVCSCQPTWDDKPEWRKISLGHLSFLRLCRESISMGARTLDFGGPPIDYKLTIGGRLVWNEEVLLLSTRPSSRLRTNLFRSASWLLHRTYIDLWRNRLAPALKGPWRPLWPAWLRSRVFPIPPAQERSHKKGVRLTFPKIKDIGRRKQFP